MRRWQFVVLATVAVLGAACSSGTGETVEPQDLTVTATDIAFDTNRLEVPAGQPVELTLENEGLLEHDFSIMHIPVAVSEAAEEEIEGHDMEGLEEQPELHVAAMPGGSNSVSFVATEPGEYSYLCTVAGHKEAGMTGTLVVSAGD